MNAEKVICFGVIAAVGDGRYVRVKNGWPFPTLIFLWTSWTSVLAEPIDRTRIIAP